MEITMSKSRYTVYLERDRQILILRSRLSERRSLTRSMAKLPGYQDSWPTAEAAQQWLDKQANPYPQRAVVCERADLGIST